MECKELFVSTNEDLVKCEHAWENLTDEKVVKDLKKKTWSIKNQECQKCFAIRQIRQRIG